jgi:DNA-binding response OmpR family regulator
MLPPMAPRLLTMAELSHNPPVKIGSDDMKTVLTVAGSKVVRSMVARGLAAVGCDLIEAADTPDGVEAARQRRPDVVLLDVTLAAVDAREALAMLRGDAATAGVPVILLTDEEGGQTAAGLGAAACVAKPFQLTTLEAEVRRLLGVPGATAPTQGRPAARGGGER